LLTKSVCECYEHFLIMNRICFFKS
jgi:hypothetical protein